MVHAVEAARVSSRPALTRNSVVLADEGCSSEHKDGAQTLFCSLDDDGVAARGQCQTQTISARADRGVFARWSPSAPSCLFRAD